MLRIETGICNNFYEGSLLIRKTWKTFQKWFGTVFGTFFSSLHKK